MDPKGLIFDFDGTLADTMPLHWHAWEIIAARHGFNLTRERLYSLGGAAPRTTRYEIDWMNPVTHDAVRIRITHQRDYLMPGTDHLSVDSIKPKKHLCRSPRPGISRTLYRHSS